MAKKYKTPLFESVILAIVTGGAGGIILGGAIPYFILERPPNLILPLIFGILGFMGAYLLFRYKIKGL